MNLSSLASVGVVRKSVVAAVASMVAGCLPAPAPTTPTPDLQATVASLVQQTVRSAERATTATVQILPDEGRAHLEPGIRHAAGYRTKPAVSGPHWQTPPTDAVPTGSPARWGAYDQPLPDEVLIHNLEHGGIGLHYRCPEGCPGLVDQLKGIMGRSSQFIVAPYPDMDHRIAITSWRHFLYLEEFDEARIKEFIEAYRDQAPESVPQNQF